ncbi:serine hydrolase domain-containing protein [Modestobacter marinus]|uniref:serine hydrolase domain-containing protein n=1 Tax=Modestobacter marinus TaxID=477641 RepID=UPI001C94F755|nr:serine hydrolase domain-containing protein [Modestobacter marinus]
MTDQRARARTPLLAALVLLAGLLAPQVAAVPAHAAAPDDTALETALQADVEAYLADRGTAEHISAAGLSVSLADRDSSIDVGAGTTSIGGAEPMRADGVWQLGSHTKAFTSVLLLQYEAEGRLSIDDPLGEWLPQYPQWADVTIRRLLNMTSGIADYDSEPAFLDAYVSDPRTHFSAEQLIGYVEDAPGTTGWSYSNTNYVLAELVVEEVTGNSYREELEERLLEPLGLGDLFYREHLYPSAVTDREPAGYFANDQVPHPYKEFVGTDTSRDTLSWARGAGGIIGTTGDLTRWARALYSGELLPAEQQAELTSLVSTTTGQPIEQTSTDDPSAFGLGVAQVIAEPLGTFWVYEGGTLGFRTLHVYLPESGVIIAIGLNSATADDQIIALALSVHETLVAQGAVPAPVAAAA